MHYKHWEYLLLLVTNSLIMTKRQLSLLLMLLKERDERYSQVAHTMHLERSALIDISCANFRAKWFRDQEMAKIVFVAVL
jgi:hypothetical protein